MRGVSGDDPEGGAGSGVLRRRLVTVCPGRPGTPRPPGTTTWLRGARCTDPEGNCPRCRTAGAEGDGSAAPRPKTATVERREASVPRHGTLGAWRAALCARPTGAAAPERFSALRPPLDSGVSEARMQTPDAKNAPRERDGLFDIVSWTETRCSSSSGGARMRKRFRKVERACARRCEAPQHEGEYGRWHFGRTRPSRADEPAVAESGRRVSSIVSGLLFTMDAATSTCRAVDGVRRHWWQDALCARRAP
jgi:hypothetical protein